MGPIKLRLTCQRGQVNVKVSIISAQQNPITMQFLLYSATPVPMLREMILEKLPPEQKQLNSAQIFLSIKKKPIDETLYLFETLYEVFKVEEDPEGNLRNQRMNSANLQRANQVEKQLVQYARTHGH